MNFDQLQYFIAVVENDTFFDAADTLHISQSALSKQIMRLERELDIQLFDRSKRKASLTNAGKTFFPEAVSLYQHYENMLSKMEIYQSIPKSLRIGTLPILTQYELTPIFRAFKIKYPDHSILLEEVEEPDLLRGLTNGKYDIVIARDHMIPAKKYKTYPIAEDELALLLPTEHPLSQQDHSVSLAELSKERLILMNPYTSIYQLCMGLFEKSDIKPNIIRTARTESIISAVSVKEGISLLPRSNFKIFHYENISIRSLDPPVTLPVVLALDRRKKLSKAASLFLSFFIKSVTDLTRK